MKREEAIKMLQSTRLMLMDGANQPISDLYYALDMAIEALGQTEPQTDCDGCQHYADKHTADACYECKRSYTDGYEPQTERNE